MSSFVHRRDDDDDDLGEDNRTAPPPKRSKKARASGVGAAGFSGAGASQYQSQRTEQLGSVHAPREAPQSQAPIRNLARENGALLCIRLQNFKSHNNFEMNFGPRLNFIVGKNGSGKSSILAGIIAALGGNPNKHSGTAGGAKAAGSLVRDGAAWAQVELEIANGGPDPFALESGAAPPKLTVSLKLSKQDSGKTTQAYAINGTSVPARRVRELADFYNYEVENPCVINTQAVSASFLRDPKDAPKRYSFFLRAANLEPLKINYRNGYEEKKLMEDRLAKHGERRIELTEQLEEAQKRAAAASERLDLERHIMQAERRSAYAILLSHKAQLASARHGVGALKDKAEALGRAEVEAKDAHRHARNEAERLNAQRKDVNARLAEHSRKAGELKKEWKAATKRVREAEGHKADAAEAQKEHGVSVVELTRRLEEQRKGLDGATRKADAALNAKIDRLGTQHASLKAQHADALRELSPLEERAATLSDGLNGAKRQAADAKREHAEAAAEASRLRRAAEGGDSGDGKAALFHRDMPNLLRAVRASPRGSWQAYPPVGPLGMHLAPKPEVSATYGDALEKACGGWFTLCAFVVGTHADATKLLAMCPPGLRSLKVMVQPSEARFPTPPPPRTRPIDSRGEVALTVLEALQPIADNTAFNALLNMQAPENCLLLRSYEDVTRLIFATNASYSRAYTPDGTSHFRRGRTTASEPSLSKSRGTATLLCGGGNDRAVIAAQAERAQQHTLTTAHAERAAAERERAASSEHREVGVAVSAMASRVRALERKVYEASGAVEVARDERATSAPAAALQEVHSELDGAKAAVAAAAADEARHAAEAERLGGVVRAVLTRLEEAHAEEASLTEAMDAKENHANSGGGSSDGAPDAAADLQARATAAQRATAAAEKARQAVRAKEEDMAAKAQTAEEKEKQVRTIYPEGPPSDLADLADGLNGGHGCGVGGEAEEGAQPMEVDGDGAPPPAARGGGLSERAAGKRPAGRGGSHSGSGSGDGAGSGVRRPKAHDVVGFEKWAREEEEHAKKEVNALHTRMRVADRKCGGSDTSGVTAQQLKEDEAAASTALEKHDTTARHCQKLHDQLGPSLQERVKFWKAALKKTSAQSSDDFNRCLSYKGLAGKLEHDHVKETLDAMVYTSSQNAHAHASRSLRTLSGGEQAFASLCFSLSMWPFSVSPLRAMDEFDKNMDNTFLQASLKHLLEASDQAATRQILILTPNDYHASLTGSVCKPLYDKLMAGASMNNPEAAIQIKNMPDVQRD